MNDKDFSEVLACFQEAGQIKAESKKPGRVSKTGPPSITQVRTKTHPAQCRTDSIETVRAKASRKKIAPLKDV